MIASMSSVRILISKLKSSIWKPYMHYLSGELSSGGSAMLAARGEGIFSWIDDDSFIVDEKTTANPEVISRLLIVFMLRIYKIF